jgi:hypothetical protein
MVRAADLMLGFGAAVSVLGSAAVGVAVLVLRLVLRFGTAIWCCGFGAAVLVLRLVLQFGCCGFGAAVLVLRLVLGSAVFGAAVFGAAVFVLRFWCYRCVLPNYRVLVASNLLLGFVLRFWCYGVLGIEVLRRARN